MNGIEYKIISIYIVLYKSALLQTIQEKDLKSAEVGAVFEVLYILKLLSLCVVENAVAFSTYLGPAKLIHLH